MWEFLRENTQKIVNALNGMLSFAVTAIAAGQLDAELGTHKGTVVFFIGMAISGLSAAGYAKANGVSAKLRVAEAMQTAIQATPGDPLPPSVTTLSQPTGVKP